MTELVDAPAPQDGVDEATNRRALVLIGIAGAVVLALLAYLLLGRGSSEDTTAFVPKVKRGLPAAGAPASLKTKPVLLPKVSTATLGRDPFRPLVSEAVPAAVGTGTVGGSTATGSGTPTAGPTSGATPAKAGPTKAPAPATYSLRLTRIDGSDGALTARFLLGKSTVQYARVGSRFGRTAEIKLLSLQTDGNGQGTAVIQVGESPFDVSTGDPAIFVQ